MASVSIAHNSAAAEEPQRKIQACVIMGQHLARACVEPLGSR